MHMKGMTEPAHSCPPFLLGFAVAAIEFLVRLLRLVRGDAK